MLEDLSTGFVELKRDEVLAAVTTRVERGDDVLEILEDARRATTVVVLPDPVGPVTRTNPRGLLHRPSTAGGSPSSRKPRIS